ncbi:hypothetical protein J31TS6_10510 [Brevibacillus reuszeri]|nr:hypothetical protein J31TS6_10510 [Brevibacillus reuszeri]
MGDVYVLLSFSKLTGVTSAKIQYSTDQQTWQDAEVDSPITSTTDQVYAKLPSFASGTYYFRMIVDGGQRAGVSNITSKHIE